MVNYKKKTSVTKKAHVILLRFYKTDLPYKSIKINSIANTQLAKYNMYFYRKIVPKYFQRNIITVDDIDIDKL